MKNMIFVLLAGLLLSGCAVSKTTTTPDGTVTTEPGSIFGPSDYSEGYAGAYGKFQESKAARVNAIVQTACPQDPTAAAYCGTSKLLGAAMVSNERFELTKPLTGMDVLNNAVGGIPMVVGLKMIKDVAVAGIKNAGSQYGDNAQLSNSGNHTESTNTAMGTNSNSGGSASGTQPAQDPVIVEQPAPIIVGQ